MDFQCDLECNFGIGCLSEWPKVDDPLQVLLMPTMVRVKGTALNSSQMLNPKGKMYTSD